MKIRVKEILFSLSVTLFAVLLFAEGGEDLTAAFRADRSAGRCSDATYLKSTVNTGSSAKNAFDGNPASVWISSVKAAGEYVGITFPVDYHFGALPYVTAFNLSTPTSATNYKTRTPTKFILQGKNPDDVSWTDIQAYEHTWDSTYSHLFSVDNPAGCRSYRIYCQANASAGGQFFTIGEIALLGDYVYASDVVLVIASDHGAVGTPNPGYGPVNVAGGSVECVAPGDALIDEEICTVVGCKVETSDDHGLTWTLKEDGRSKSYMYEKDESVLTRVTWKWGAKTAADIYVNAESGDDLDGDGSEEKPYKSIARAAAGLGDGSTLHLSSGTYPITDAIELTRVNLVRIVGEGKGETVIVSEAGCKTRFLALTECGGVTLEGVTVRGCMSEGEDAKGGALFVSGGDILIRDVAFVGNIVSNGISSTSLSGGAIYSSGASLTITNCDFIGNRVVSTAQGKVQGGALFYANESDSLKVSDAVFNDNVLSSDLSSGKSDSQQGLAVYSAGSIAFSNCSVMYNKCTGVTTGEGAIFLTSQKSPTFRRCTVAWNGTGNGVVVNTTQFYAYDTIIWGHEYDIDNAGSCAMRADGLVYGTIASAVEESVNWRNVYRSDPGIGLNGWPLENGIAAVKGYGYRAKFAPSVHSYWVDPVGGDDQNSGTRDAPFQTLGKAVSVLASGDCVILLPGRYGVDNGDKFPMVIKGFNAISILGQEAKSVMLDGAGVDRNGALLTLDTLADFTMSGVSITGANVANGGADVLPRVFASSTTPIQVGHPSALEVYACAGMRFSNLNVYGNVLFGSDSQASCGAVRFDLSHAISWMGGSISCNSNVLTAAASAYGLGILANYSYATLDAVSIADNEFVPSVRGTSAYGAAVCTASSNVSGAQDGTVGRVSFRNCLIAGNRMGATAAGGALNGTVYVGVGRNTTSFANCTIAENGVGAVVSRLNSTARFDNSIIFGNGGTDFAFADEFGYSRGFILDTCLVDSADSAFLTTERTNTTIVNCTPIEAPCYRTVDGFRYALWSGSPAVDSAKRLSWMTDESVDVLGRKRVVGYKDKNSKIPDVGCFELQRNFGLVLIVR